MTDPGETYGSTAEPLLGNGYHPIPVVARDKRPAIANWTEPMSAEATLKLAANGKADCSCGLLVGLELGDGTEVRGLDVDAYDEALSRRLHATVPHLDVVRVGQRPKWLALCRVVVGTPELVSAKWGREKHHVQLLGRGRQCVLFGVHPSTGRPYQWPLRSPLEVPTLKLPLLTLADWERLTEELDAWAAEEQLGMAAPASAAVRALEDVSHIPDPPVDLDLEQVRELIWLFREDRHTYDPWSQMGMALWHQFNGGLQGKQLWIEWSGDVAADVFGGFERWDSFRPRPGQRQRTLRTYIKRAQALGWRPRVRVNSGTTTVELGEAPMVLCVAPIGTLADEPYNPPDVIEGLVPVDAGGLVAPGGLGKTTLDLYVGVHVMLGKACFGHEISRPGPVLYVTAEDDLRTLVGRLGAIAAALELSPAERQLVADNFYVVDVSAEARRLLTVTREGARVSDWAKGLVDTYRPVRPALVHLDPVSLLGPGEESGNDGMAELMRTCRWMSRELGGAVQATHHTGQAVARERIHDQYAGRGGTAFADNARFLLQLDRLRERTFKVEGANWRAPSEVRDEDLHAGRVSVLMAHKHSYRAVREAPIVLVRTGWRFDWLDAVPADDQQELRVAAERELAEVGERVLALLTEGLAGGTRYSRSTLEDVREVRLPGVSRGKLRAAITTLIQLGQVEEAPIVGATTGFRSWLRPCG